jgi:hypothetical protein
MTVAANEELELKGVVKGVVEEQYDYALAARIVAAHIRAADVYDKQTQAQSQPQPKPQPIPQHDPQPVEDLSALAPQFEARMSTPRVIDQSTNATGPPDHPKMNISELAKY